MANKINSWAQFQDFMDACCVKAGANPDNSGHGRWWRGDPPMTHHNFITDATVKGLRIVQVGDPDNSNVIHALRGDTDEFSAKGDFGRMPANSDRYFEKDDIDEIADWIKRGCPDTPPAPPAA